MPYVNIRVTKEGVTAVQKLELIAGASNLLQRVPSKHPSTTVVVIDAVETDNRGLNGETVTSLCAPEALEYSRARARMSGANRTR